MKNILHVSDFHVSHKADRGMQSHRLKELLGFLLADVEAICKIDTILITGDITYSGHAEEYEIFERVFLSPMLTKLGLNCSRVIVTPGNHDSDRSSWRATEKTSRTNIISNINQNDIEAVLKEITSDGQCSRLQNFYAFKKKLDNHAEKKLVLDTPIYSVYDVDGVGIGALNTAWMSFDNDETNLVIGEYQIKEVINKLKPFDQRALIFHHPADWLHSDDRRIVFDMIHRSKIQSLFYGHMHDFRVTKESQFDENSLLKLQAGKLDISRKDNYGGYSVLKLNQKNNFDDGLIVFRKFDHSSNKFTPWIERLENGQHEYTLDKSVVFNTSAFAKICQTKIEEIEYDLICNTGLQGNYRKKLSDIFVFPALVIDDDSLGISKDSQSNVINLNNLVTMENSCVILGAENSGKSTLGKKIALYYLNELSNENLETFVFYLDIKNANLKSTNQIKNQLVSFFTEIEDADIFSKRIESKLLSKNAVIIFDSIEALDQNHEKSFEQFLKAHSQAKYFIFGKNSAKTSVKNLLSNAFNGQHKIDFNYYSIKNIKRSQIRDLFGRWSTDKAGNKELLIKNALKIVDSAGMPNNPFVYTMLLSISERKATIQKNYMHEADVVENFIETILEKHVALNNDKSPQYKDLLLFLGSVANQMHTSGNYIIRSDELFEKAISFNKSIYQNFKIQNYIDPVIKSGILEEHKDGYIFSQSCFFNYIYANWLNHPENLKTYDDLDLQLDFIYFDKVIEYLSALRKSDVALLEYLNVKTELAWEHLLSTTKIKDLNSAEAEIASNVGHDLIDLIDVKSIEQPIEGSYPSADEVENDLDEANPLSEYPVKEILTAKDTLKPSVYFFQTLSLYARTYRAAEHILKLETTSAHFNKIVEYYMSALAYLVRDFSMSGRDKFLSILKKEMALDELDERNKENSIRQINAFMNFIISFFPEYIVSLMTSELFNQRQKVKLETFRALEKSNLTKIILTYCLCELDGVSIVNELKSQNFTKPYESTSLFIKVIMLINFDFSITNDDKKELESYLRNILKHRKGLQEVINFTTISNKIGSLDKGSS